MEIICLNYIQKFLQNKHKNCSNKKDYDIDFNQ